MSVFSVTGEGAVMMVLVRHSCVVLAVPCAYSTPLACVCCCHHRMIWKQTKDEQKVKLDWLVGSVTLILL